MKTRPAFSVQAGILLLCILIIHPKTQAATLRLKNGISVEMAAYKNMETRPNGATCVTAAEKNLNLTICIFPSKFEVAAEENLFFQYEDLPEDAKRQTGPLPKDTIVYASGSWLYPTRQFKTGGFDVFEADNVLCNVGTPTQKNVHRDCYFAALRPSPANPAPVTIITSAGISNPRRKAHQLKRIHEFIKTIRISPKGI